MSWQDLVITVGNIIFALALVPSVRSHDKPHLLTSIPTTIALFAFVIAFASLNLVFSAILCSVTTSLWATLAVQKFRSKNKKSNETS